MVEIHPYSSDFVYIPISILIAWWYMSPADYTTSQTSIHEKIKVFNKHQVLKMYCPYWIKVWTMGILYTYVWN